MSEMRPEEIRDIFLSTVTTKEVGTHAAFIDGRFVTLLMDESREYQMDTLARFVYESNRMKEPLSMSEKLGEATAAAPGSARAKSLGRLSRSSST